MTDRQRIDALLDELARLQRKLVELEMILDVLAFTTPSGLILPRPDDSSANG
jgi:hypothetical protein